MALLKSKDFLLYRTGNTEPTAANGYLTDGYVQITENPVTYSVNHVGTGKGNASDEKEVKDNVKISLNAGISLFEPVDIASGLPQFELLEGAGFKQEIDTTNNKITLYPSLDVNKGTAVYYKGGVMKYLISGIVSDFGITASAANTRVIGNLTMNGTYNPDEVQNATGVTPTFTETSYFSLTRDSKVVVNGVEKCPFGDISLTMNPQINTGDDSQVCADIVLEDYAPMLSFSEVLDSTGGSNLVPITNWLNDSDVTISFFLYSKNYKLELKVNKGKERRGESGESGLKWLQRRNIRLFDDANGRAFELIITPR